MLVISAAKVYANSAYVVGTHYASNLTFQVDDSLIPRPETIQNLGADDTEVLRNQVSWNSRRDVYQSRRPCITCRKGKLQEWESASRNAASVIREGPNQRRKAQTYRRRQGSRKALFAGARNTYGTRRTISDQP